MTFHVARQGRVAVLGIEGGVPPAPGAVLRADLRAALDAVLADPAIQAVALSLGGSGATGADRDGALSDDPLAEDPPSLAALCDRLESAPIPVVAGLSGPVLDSAADLALAAHFRIVGRDVRFGFPASRRGLLPFGGAPVRLVALAGESVARDLLRSSRLLSAQGAEACGLADGVAKGVPDRAAAALARRLAAVGAGPRPKRDRERGNGACQRLTGHDTCPPDLGEAVSDLLRIATRAPYPSAVEASVARARLLSSGPEAKRLATMEAAERAVRPPQDVRPCAIERIAVVGLSDAMEEATCLLADLLGAGADILLVGPEDLAAKAVDRIAAWLDLHGIDRQQATRLKAVPFLDAQDRPDLVLRLGGPEAGSPPPVPVLALGREASGAVPRGGLLLRAPVRLPTRPGLLQIGAPVDVAPALLSALAILADRMDRRPVLTRLHAPDVCAVLFAAWRGALDRLVEDGMAPAEVDRILEAAGHALGVYARSDLRGLATEVEGRRAMSRYRDPRLRHPTLVDRLVGQGRTGWAAGAGFRLWDGPDRLEADDTGLERSLREARQAAGVAARPVSGAEVLDRGALAVALAARALVGSGTVSREAIGVAATAGLGMPRHGGGPFAWLDEIGPAEVEARRGHLARVEDALFWAEPDGSVHGERAGGRHAP